MQEDKMGETQGNLLEVEAGTTDMERKSLEPKKVKIVKIRTEYIEKIKATKAIFTVKHPDREDEIEISSISHLVNKSVDTVGSWVSLDKEKKLQKGTALVSLLNKLGAKTLKDLEGKEVETELDGKYLALKAY